MTGAPLIIFHPLQHFINMTVWLLGIFWLGIVNERACMFSQTEFHPVLACSFRMGRSWGKSAFRDYLWDNKLDSWDFIFIGNFENSELGIEIKNTSIFWYFSEQSNRDVNVIMPVWLNYQGRFALLPDWCLCAYIYNLILYAHHYAEKTNHERNEKSWELSERSKTINMPFLVNGRFFGKIALFQDKAFFLR